ncbi:hypothetical protein POZ13_16105, partial [Bacteroides uniformis]|uniref:hypothetical protein n=1 Tax=Bacteroides uniformis TaxID=820 RepID=UPI00233EF7C0
ITKPGLEKVWALRIKKGCVSILTQPPFHINPHPHSVYMLTQCLVFKIGIYHHFTHFIKTS